MSVVTSTVRGVVLPVVRAVVNSMNALLARITVLNSAETGFGVTRQVRNSTGQIFDVSADVKNSTGAGFTVI